MSSLTPQHTTRHCVYVCLSDPLRLAGLFLSLVFTILLAYFFHKQYKRMIMARASHAGRNDGQSLEEGPAPEQHDMGENGAREPSFTTTEPARQPHVY